MPAIKYGTLANSTVIVTAVVYAILLQLAMAARIAGFLLGMMVMLSQVRYGYAVLRHVASGWQNFPPPDIESMNIFGGPFGVILHSVLFGSSIFLLTTTPFVDGLARWIPLVLLLVTFPASAAIMALTRNIAVALNPAAIAGLVHDLGVDYVKLLGISVLLGIFLVVMGALADSWLLGLLLSMLAVWTQLALFLAIGATVRAHRDTFSLAEALDDVEARDTRRKHADWQKALDIAYGSVRSGLAAQAYRQVKDLIATEGDSLEIYQWAFNGMLQWDPPEHAAMLGERFAQRLWEEGRKVDAMELTQRCRKLSPKFELPAPFRMELAEYARSLGRHRLADELSAR